ncbi:MAG: MOSC domain-containing protein [Pseudomonadota bacterium]
MTETTLDALFMGAIRHLWPGKPPSAIAKTPVRAARVQVTGLLGDIQADLRVHGGPAKAVHVYPSQHYGWWASQLGPNARFTPGGFGENISQSAWTERDVCIGDVWRVGTAVLQVSQGRQPCWKLGAHVGDDRMADLVRTSLRTGWYMRVIEEGEIGIGDTIQRIDRPQPDVSVARVARAIFDKRTAPGECAALACVPELDDAWAAILGRRAAIA